MLEDKEITCARCSNVFVWEAGEQAYYHDKGLQAPRNCPKCRKERHKELEGRGE